MKQLLLLPLAAILFCTTATFAQPGSPDPAFGGGDGFVITTAFLPNGHSYPNAVALQSDGKIVVVGSTWVPQSGQASQIALARYMPNGSSDQTFSGDGKLTILLDNVSASANAIVIQPDGKFLLAGNAWIGDSSFFFLARYKNDGTPDHTFDGEGIVITAVSAFQESASALALQPDGKIVVVGYANLTGYDEFAVVRYKSNGTPDDSFGGGDGIVTTPVGDAWASASSVMIQPDGKIVVAGYAETNGFEDFAAVRYKANGTLDPFFGSGGIATLSITDKNDCAYGAVLQSDGKIVLAGYAGATGGPADVEFAVARLTANGLPDGSFSGDGLATIHVSEYADGARGVVLQSDGKILVGGYAHSNGTNGGDFAVVRLTTQGLPDGTFGMGGLATLATSPSSENITDIAMQPDGKIIAVGTSWFDSRHFFGVARFLTGATVATELPASFSGEISLYPNPVREQATLEYTLETSEKIAVNLYDAQGRFLQNLLPSTQKAAGQHVETLPFSGDLPPGQYFVAVESEKGRVLLKAIL